MHVEEMDRTETLQHCQHLQRAWQPETACWLQSDHGPKDFLTRNRGPDLEGERRWWLSGIAGASRCEVEWTMKQWQAELGTDANLLLIRPLLPQLPRP